MGRNMEITQKEFNEKFKRLPKQIQKEFILRCGLKHKYENVLILWYIDELDYISIGDRVGMQGESVANMIVDAKKQLRAFAILNYEYDEEFRKLIDLLFK